MKMQSINYIAALLSLIMLLGVITACGGGNKTDETDPISQSASRTESTDATEGVTDTATEGDDEKENDGEESSDSGVASLPIGNLSVKNGEMIEYANYLADGVDVYYGDGMRSFAVVAGKNGYVCSYGIRSNC